MGHPSDRVTHCTHSSSAGSLAVGDVIVEVNGKDAGMEGELGPLLPPAKATVSSGGMVRRVRRAMALVLLLLMR